MIGFLIGVLFCYLGVALAVLGFTHYYSKKSMFPLTKEEWYYFTLDVLRWPFMLKKWVAEDFRAL